MELHEREMADEFCLKMPDFHVTFRNLLHAVNLRHGTDGFTSPPKEGVLRIFFFARLRSGLNPRTWVPKASTVPLDHRSRICRLSTFYHLQARLQNCGDNCQLYHVRPSVRMEQLGSHCTDFHQIWYMFIFRKSAEEIKFSRECG